MKLIKRVLYIQKPNIYLLFTVGSIRVLDVRKLDCQHCLDNIEKVKVEELGGLEWDLLHSVCPDMAYKLSRPIRKDELLRLIIKLLQNKKVTVRKLSRALATTLSL